MTDDRTQELRRLLELQARVNTALLRLLAQWLHPSADTFERYLLVARPLVAQASRFDEHSRGVIDVPTLASPLVKQLSRYADLCEGEGDRAAAQALRAEADDLAARHLGKGARAELQRTRATEALSAGRYHEAIIGLDAAAAAFEGQREHVQAAQTLVTLANVHEWLGDYERALTLLDRAEASVADDLPGAKPPSALAVGIGLTRQAVGILRGRSGREGEELMELRRLGVEILQGRARVHRWLGDYPQARALFERARRGVPRSARVGVDMQIVAIAVAAGALDEAERLLAACEPALRQGPARRRLAVLHLHEADLALARRRPEQALAAADAGLAEQRQYPDLELAWKLQWRRAKALDALQRKADALTAYREAASSADAQRMAPLGYHLDSLFLRDKQPMIEEAMDYAVAVGDAPAAVWFIELVKSRALSATLSLPRTPVEVDSLEADSVDGDSVDGDSAGTARFEELSAEI